jgi:hypothetical protein
VENATIKGKQAEEQSQPATKTEQANVQEVQHEAMKRQY